jgi:hypothetical protein
MKNLIARIRRFGRRVQAVALRAALWLVYLVVLGVTRLWAALFHRALLAAAPADAPSYWITAEGYATDPAERGRQS